MLKRWVKFRGKWIKAEETIDEFVSEPYFVVCGHVISRKDIEEIGPIAFEISFDDEKN